MIQKPRGTRDFLPAEMTQRRFVEQKMRSVAAGFGYGEIVTPMFEEQELFTIKSGEGIINEMYAFEDKGGRKLTLRPELTSAVLRAYVNEAQMAPKPLRWFYFAECFRYERPQKGRYRQFWQFGSELIGA
ncbi:MAG: ATP phosphoribosyltransferase regulatory subunit, partial [Methanocorpusculum sp.]|nr:ATP phosphoribosyltransferase regulatory subunit [Methanocorpusculum sp.]MDD4423360.1 ATP phosphoribosyltransferase regulatory subunit [Methanocorpusculum parvum]